MRKIHRFVIFRFPALAVLAAWVTACSTYGKIQIRKDEFKQVSVVSLKLKCESEESVRAPVFTFLRYKGELEFTREVGASTGKPTTVVLLAHVGPDAAALAKTAYLKIDSERVELTWLESTSEIQSNTTSQTTRTKYYAQDSSGFVDYSKPVAVDNDTQVSTTTWRELRGTLQLDQSTEQKILAGNSLEIRIYSGSEPLTFAIERDDLLKIKEFLQVDPNTG